MALLVQGNSEAAIDCLNKSIKLHPDNPYVKKMKETLQNITQKVTLKNKGFSNQ